MGEFLFRFCFFSCNVNIIKKYLLMIVINLQRKCTYNRALYKALVL